MLEMLLYELRLAHISLRRDRALTAAMIVGLALGTSVWTTANLHALRTYGPGDPLSPDLHQVEIPHPASAVERLGPGAGYAGAIAARVRVTYPEYEALSSSGIPPRETAAFRSRVAVQVPGGRPHLVLVRFVNADFFDLFARTFRTGTAWSRSQESADAPVAVVSRALDEQLFGGNAALGDTLLVEGRTFRVAGALANPQPFAPAWEISSIAMDADSLYLPLPSFHKLRARPELVVPQSSGAGGNFEQLLQSDAVFVSYWMSLPTPETRAAYQRFLDTRFTNSGPKRPVLRALPEWRRDVGSPTTPVVIFVLITGLVLLSAGFGVMRLLLAKGLSRREELGIYRALGASRLSLFGRQMLEATMVAVPGAVAGAALSSLYVAIWNHHLIDLDVPLVLTPMGFAFGAVTAIFVGLGSAVYPAWRLSNVAPTISAARR